MTQFVKVVYPTNRSVNADRLTLGDTGEVLPIDAGNPIFDLGKPLDYMPASQRVRVGGTTQDNPKIIIFAPIITVADIAEPMPAPRLKMAKRVGGERPGAAAKRGATKVVKNAAKQTTKNTAKKTAKKGVKKATKTIAKKAEKETAKKKIAKKLTSKAATTAPAKAAKKTIKKASKKIVKPATKNGAKKITKRSTKKAVRKTARHTS